MADLQKAYEWAVNTCNRSDVGYHQSYRNEQTVDGITYYDCSSFIWYALKTGGFDVVGAYETALWGYEGNAVTTAYLDGWLFALGFKEIPIAEEWKAGDVLWRDGHTEMVYSGRTTMGAHGRNGIALADQVSINSSPSSVSSWTRCFRYEGGASEEPVIPEWIKGNRYLSESEKQNNATIVYYILKGYGWSDNAIAGILGNMEQESNINPGLWQSLKEYNYSLGFGLVQWTPATNYTNWAESNGYAIDDGNGQLKWIEEETVKQGQWIKTSAYDLSFADFKVSNESVEYLTMAFLKNFERAGTEESDKRIAYAEKWYTFINSLPSGGITPPVTPDQPSDPTKPPKKKHSYKFYLFVKR